nr:hypothetical protein [Tanacetum cinerariifolium]
MSPGICGTHLFAGDYRWGRNPLRAFSSDYSPAISRRGNSFPATSRRGKPGFVAGKALNGNVDASYAIEGHGDNEGGLYRLKTRPIPTHPSGRRLDTLEEPAPNVEASKFLRLVCFPIP